MTGRDANLDIGSVGNTETLRLGEMCAIVGAVPSVQPDSLESGSFLSTQR